MKKLLYACSLFVLLSGLMMAGCSEEKKDMSMKMNHPRNIRGVISYKRSFGDLNNVQLATARKIGIRPIETREEAEEMTGRLVEIAPCELYDVDSLTHSIPYLIPQAGALLDTIGANFLDSLECKGLNPNRIIVTSVTPSVIMEGTTVYFIAGTSSTQPSFQYAVTISPVVSNASPSA